MRRHNRRRRGEAAEEVGSAWSTWARRESNRETFALLNLGRLTPVTGRSAPTRTIVPSPRGARLALYGCAATPDLAVHQRHHDHVRLFAVGIAHARRAERRVSRVGRARGATLHRPS